MQFTDKTIREQEYPQPQQVIITSGGTAVVVLSMLLLTIIILYITSRNADSAPYGIIGSVAFFLFGTPIGLLAVNRGWVEIYRVAQEQHTLRRYNDQQARLQAVQVVDHPRIGYSEPVARPQLPQGPTFVPAVPRVAETIKVDAASFVTQLFDTATGRPLPNKITRNKGQIQHKSPSPEAVEYLASLGIVSAPEGKQLYYNVAHFPTLREAMNTIKTGRKPSYEESKEEGVEGYMEGVTA